MINEAIFLRFKRKKIAEGKAEHVHCSSPRIYHHFPRLYLQAARLSRRWCLGGG
jgi:hypothetical protein